MFNNWIIACNLRFQIFPHWFSWILNFDVGVTKSAHNKIIFLFLDFECGFSSLTGQIVSNIRHVLIECLQGYCGNVRSSLLTFTLGSFLV